MRWRITSGTTLPSGPMSASPRTCLGAATAPLGAGGATRTRSVYFLSPGVRAVCPCGRHHDTLTVLESAGLVALRGASGSAGDASSTVGRRELTAQTNWAGSGGRPGESGWDIPGGGAASEAAPLVSSLSSHPSASMLVLVELELLPTPLVPVTRPTDASWAFRYRCNRALLLRPSSVGHAHGSSASTQFGHGAGGSAPHLDLRWRHCECELERAQQTYLETCGAAARKLVSLCWGTAVVPLARGGGGLAL